MRKGETTMAEIQRRKKAVPFMIAFILALFLITYVEPVSLVLVDLFGA